MSAKSRTAALSILMGSLGGLLWNNVGLGQPERDLRVLPSAVSEGTPMGATDPNQIVASQPRGSDGLGRLVEPGAIISDSPNSEQLAIPALLGEASQPVPDFRDMSVEQMDLVALVLWREARGEGLRGMQAVMNVISNSAGGVPKYFSDACTAKGRFASLGGMTSSDYPAAIAQARQKDSDSFYRALELVERARQGQLEDITGGSVYYMTVAESNRRADAIGRGIRRSGWWETLCEQAEEVGHPKIIIGRHVFVWAPSDDVVVRRAQRYRDEVGHTSIEIAGN